MPWSGIIFIKRRLGAQALQQLIVSCPGLDFLSSAVVMSGKSTSDQAVRASCSLPCQPVP